MHRHTFSRQDLFQVISFTIFGGAVGLLGALILHPIAGILSMLFLIGLIPFVNDMVAKDRYDAPRFRCDGCGNLYSEERANAWNGYTLCRSCQKDSTEQKRFATKFPMLIKRLRKH